MPTPKDVLRARVSQQRSALSPAQWRSDDERRTQALLRALPTDARTVACYASRPGEPDTTAIIDALHGRGATVLLPVISPTGPHAWGWAAFAGWDATAPAWGGIPQPSTADLGPAALMLAEVIVVACLAVGRDGTRLGTGGGWYDRALARRRGGTPVWALARADEVFETVPTEDHDIPVTGWCTEAGACTV